MRIRLQEVRSTEIARVINDDDDDDTCPAVVEWFLC